jgi:acylglycerol lipase
MEPQYRPYTAADGADLVMAVWQPARPRTAAIYLHGIQSHSKWYEASSRRLAESGAAVYQLERRGSGSNGQNESGHVDRAEVWLDDVEAAADLARRETGCTSVHLLGVSWGGKLAMAAAGRRPDLYQSLILAAPGILPRIDVSVGTKVRIALSLLLGRDLQRFPVPLADPHLFTENPARLKYVAEDELSLRRVTARFLYESRRLDKMALAAARRLTLPVFLALAETDRIIDSARTQALIEAMPSTRRRIVTYPGSHHTLEFDLDPEPYLADLVRWITEF